MKAVEAIVIVRSPYNIHGLGAAKACRSPCDEAAVMHFLKKPLDKTRVLP